MEKRPGIRPDRECPGVLARRAEKEISPYGHAARTETVEVKRLADDISPYGHAASGSGQEAIKLFPCSIEYRKENGFSMCLAVPLKLVEVNGNDAVGEMDGIRRRIRTDFIPDARIGEYVIVHAGFAIERLKAEQAEENRRAIREVEDALAGME